MTPAILVPRRGNFGVEAAPPFALSTNAAGAEPGSGFGSTQTIKWSARRSASPWEGAVSSTAIAFTLAAVSLSA